MWFVCLFLINYALKGLLVASSHTIKPGCSFPIKKKNCCCESNKESDPDSLLLGYEESKWKKGLLKQYRACSRNVKILWGKGRNCVLMTGTPACDSIVQIDIHNLVNKVLGGKRFVYNHWYFHFCKGQRNHSISFGDENSFSKDFNYYCSWEGLRSLADTFVKMIDENSDKENRRLISYSLEMFSSKTAWQWLQECHSGLYRTLKLLLGVEALGTVCMCVPRSTAWCHRDAPTPRTCGISIFKGLAEGLEFKPRNEEEAAEMTLKPFLALILQPDNSEIHLYPSFCVD